MSTIAERVRQAAAIKPDRLNSSLCYDDYDFKLGSAALAYYDLITDVDQLPDMPSRSGCVTTAAAYATQYFDEVQSVTAEEMDERTGREPNQYGSEYAAVLAMLECGLQIVHYIPTIGQKFGLPFLEGKIDFDTMNTGYDTFQGTTTSPEDYDFLRLHHERFRENYQNICPELDRHREKGTLVETTQDFTPRLLGELFCKGAAVILGIETDRAAEKHMVVVSRPNLNFPAIFFNPREATYYPSDDETIGSVIEIYDYALQETIIINSSIYAVTPRL